MSNFSVQSSALCACMLAGRQKPVFMSNQQETMGMVVSCKAQERPNCCMLLLFKSLLREVAIRNILSVRQQAGRRFHCH